jgi:hypothetical protein
VPSSIESLQTCQAGRHSLPAFPLCICYTFQFAGSAVLNREIFFFLLPFNW